MRLIDADELRKLFKEEFKRTKQMINDGQTHLDTLAEGYAEADHLLRFMALTVDAVPVVRCKDCEHWHEDIGGCDIHSHFQSSNGEFCHPWESSDWKMFTPDYFCADGKRREKND